MSSQSRPLLSFDFNAVTNMFSEEDFKPGASGPTILDLTVARTNSGLSYAKDWNADTLGHLCQAHGVHLGSIDDKEMLLAMLEKSLNQPVVYEGFELQDLTKFIEARRLSSHRSSTNTVTTRLSLQGTSHLQQSECQEKFTLGGTGHLSLKRNPESTIPTERLSHETRSINTSTKLNIVLDGLKTVFNGFMTVSPQEDQLAVVAPSPSEPDQTKSTLIEVPETADHNTCFNFLGLPAEIRQIVYDLTCRASLPIFHPQRQPAITKACRLTRAEALPIYYRYNRFAMIVGALHEIKVIELDIKLHGEIRYHFKTRKLPSKKVTTQHSRIARHNRGRRCGFGQALNRSRNALEQFDNDGLAPVLGMPTHHEDDYIELECQLADRIQIVVDKENFEASERRARYGDVESRMSLNRSSFFPTCLPLEDWELLQREWKLAQGFSILGLRALTYALHAGSFWEKRL
ncbi:hypothetical protein KCU77_g1975, partial [Aureobasidium melanogenum]